MPSRAERLHNILVDPLAYIHGQRLSVPEMFDTAEARQVISRILWQRLVPAEYCEPVQAGSVAAVFIDHWSLLPQVALLMGVQASWPHLARGALMRQLSASVRAFGPCAVSPRLQSVVFKEGDITDQLTALGLGRLLAWRAQLPDPLTARLFLQFSPEVVKQQLSLPACTPDAALLTLAIQHARICSHPH